ncbi:MAG: hypothetical protein QW674_00835 [Candidatus Bathyarchaeia archaeon]
MKPVVWSSMNSPVLIPISLGDFVLKQFGIIAASPSTLSIQQR